MAYSLVIISRNRPEFVARLLGYFHTQGLGAPIFLGDASTGGMRDEIVEVIGKFRGKLNITLTAYPDSISVMERLQSEYAKVETEYVAWVGDDDFLVPAGLDAAAALMDARPDCVAVVGKAVAFSVEGDAVQGRVLTIADYLQSPVCQDRPADRLLAQSGQGAAFTYSLRRTALTQRIMSDLEPRFWPDDVFGYFFFEVLDGFITAMAGKVVATDRLMMARQLHLASSNASGWTRTNAFRLVTHQRWPEFAAKVSGIIANMLLAEDGLLSRVEAEEAGELALWTRVNMSLNKGLKRELARRNPVTSSALQRVKEAIKEGAPWAARGAALLRQRQALSARDFSELKAIMGVIESHAPPARGLFPAKVSP